MMTELYVEGTQDGSSVFVPCSSAVVLQLLSFCNTPNIHLTLVSNAPSSSNTLCLPTTCITQPNLTVTNAEQSPPLINQCNLPALVPANSNKVISGLCGVLRKIVILSSAEEKELLSLLGRREICLKACAEVSVWTKFCEVEIPAVVDRYLQARSGDNGTAIVPVTLLKLENHFKQPAIVANIAKRKLELKKKYKESSGNATKSSNEWENELGHPFVEGVDFTLSDLVIFFSLSCLLRVWGVDLEELRAHLPLTMDWFCRLCQMSQVASSLTRLGLSVMTDESDSKRGSLVKNLALPEGNSQNFNIRDEKKKKFKANRKDILDVVVKIKDLHLDEQLAPEADDSAVLPWSDYPEGIHPKDGDLPADRLQRKCQQLESLAAAVTHLARPGHTIVDFCSGGGHLGILLAYLLPKCKIILVENKEESVMKAEHRISKLALKNIHIYQCNLDYFHGDFDIGTCLHACGVATDLVLQCCLNKKAAFVVCPCCYGSIQNTHTVTYPRSNKFTDHLTYQDCLLLGHGADQTQHNIPAAQLGKECMLMVDSDRASNAQEHGYNVVITTLHPPTCSPKNDLLIGTRPM